MSEPALEVVSTPFGKFQINPKDGIGSTTKAGTLWDGPGFLQPIAREYGELGTPGMTILHVGANIGTYSVWLASQDAWRVIAVEPAPLTMQMLKANLDLNKESCADRVIPLEIGAYSHSTALWLKDWNPNNLGATACTNEPQEVKAWVRGEPLDAYRWLFGRKVSLVKIDTQGCDGAAIVGLQETIKRDHPAVVFEWEAEFPAEQGVSWGDLQRAFENWGYAIHPWPSQPNNFLATWSPR